MLTSAPVLAHPDYEKPFVIYTGVALGATLSQDSGEGDRPIAYQGRALSVAEKNYSVTEREFLAIVFALKRFRRHTFGVRFTIVTDHAPCVTSLIRLTQRVG